MYNVIFSPDAQKDIANLKKKAPNAFKKFGKIYEELKEHPKTGTGQCEQLKHYSEETWSRRLDKEHRIVYRVYDDRVEVYVLSAFGHY
ncbi:MAG: Txe/YoeB family addiction module toxin [Bacteroidales bacterium]|nr:Txe/YoeB family addiction module toxin [Bacteroidales bacterium]